MQPLPVECNRRDDLIAQIYLLHSVFALPSIINIIHKCIHGQSIHCCTSIAIQYYPDHVENAENIQLQPICPLDFSVKDLYFPPRNPQISQFSGSIYLHSILLLVLCAKPVLNALEKTQA